MTTTTTTERPAAVPAAILTETDILQEAARALQAHDSARTAQRTLEGHLRALCRQFDAAAGTRGCSPDHLRRACSIRGML